MHMSDALLSTPVALTAAAAAGALLVVAGRKVARSGRSDIVPLMGVTGAFVFAAQMINFTIPGTGSSGHIVGGILLAAMLGPWAAFLALSSVLVIQCLVFADGGLLALGCNIINMAGFTCLVGYPLIFKPILGRSHSYARIVAASLAACIVALELGALAVVGETELSGITALPAKGFMAFMLPIHLVIGLGEGLATAAVLTFVARQSPDLLVDNETAAGRTRKLNLKPLIIGFAVAAIIVGGFLAFFASSNPDGLEWAIGKMGATEQLESTVPTGVAATASAIQESTGLMPDYDNSLSGIVGAAFVVLLLWIITTLLMRRRKKSK